MRTTVSFIAMLIASLPLLTNAEDWSRFRGPNGSGRADSTEPLPVKWSEGSGVRWKVPVLRGSSSPIVVAGKIFISGYSGYAIDPDDPGEREALRLHVMAYDAASGTRLWDYEFAASEDEQEATNRVADHGYASPTPCSDGAAVYAAFGPSGVIALDLEGKLLWRQDVGSKTAGFGAASSPIEFENLVLINASIESKTLFALNKKTGYVEWKLEGIDRAWTTPALVTMGDGSTELVIHHQQKIRGIDPLSGKELWTCAGIEDYIVPIPVVDGETVYFSGGRQNRTIAVRAGGRDDVSDTHKLWEVANGANVTTPVYHDGHLYWSHDRAIAQAMNATTGEMDYQKRFPSTERVYASAIYGDGKLYMTQRDGTTLVLAAKPEYEELANNKLGGGDEQFNATPAVMDGKLIFRSTKHLYCIGTD